MIIDIAAKGLAKLQDPRAIPALIDAGRQNPGEARGGTDALLFFDDPKAQAAAEELSDDKKILEGLRSEIKKQGLKLWFPW